MRNLLVALLLVLSQTAIIPISMTISSPPNYRNLLTLRYGELQKHNLLRSRHQSPALDLSRQLNQQAQAQAQEMLKSGIIAYSQDAMMGTIGENIYGAFAPGVLNYRPHTASKYWYKEAANYNYQTGQSINPDKEIWEFTSMIWKGVKEMGVGYAYGPGTISGRDGTFIYIVTKYKPAPNVIGKFKENLFPTKEPLNQ